MRKSHLPDQRRVWKINRRNLLIELLGSQCVECGSTKKLEFDHVLPEDKLFTISQILDRRLEIILPELQKCQLLCRKHHINKSLSDRDQEYAEHGTSGMYTNHACRCELCKTNWAVYSLKYTHAYRARQSIQPVV